jgi:hypothetical protein
MIALVICIVFLSVESISVLIMVMGKLFFSTEEFVDEEITEQSEVPEQEGIIQKCNVRKIFLTPPHPRSPTILGKEILISHSANALLHPTPLL